MGVLCVKLRYLGLWGSCAGRMQTHNSKQDFVNEVQVLPFRIQKHFLFVRVLCLCVKISESVFRLR